jgi:hypothetical protein
MKAALLLLMAACSGTEEPPAEIRWETAFDAAELGWFLYTWGPSADDVYAVGGTPAEGLIMHFDGTAWTKVDTGLSFPLLNWCYGFGSDDITFVGTFGTVLHFDGAIFTKESTPTDQDLWGVWGSAPNDLWSVGGRGSAENQATILHYDGTEWTASSTPALTRENVFAYFKVWGAAADDIYAVGQRGVVVHWDGARWSEVVTEADDDLVGVWGTGPNRIVAAGGRSKGQVIAFDGSEWRHRSLELPGLNGVWSDGGAFHLAGTQGTVASLDFDTLEVATERSDTFLTLHGIFGTTDNLYAVGGSLLDLRPPYRGVALARSIDVASHQ